MVFKARHYSFDFRRLGRVLIVGILNVTPDSFSDGGRYMQPEDACHRAYEMAAEGADIIDIGAESTRPGSGGVSAAEEQRRIMPVLEKILHAVTVPISIDTSKSDVAHACLEAGATIINDVSGLRRDPLMATVVKQFNAGLILMHMRGEPATMQQYATYDNVLKEVVVELRESIAIATHAGIQRDHIIVDPGIGFAKTVEHNIAIIRNIKALRKLKRPILIGPSRKSFVGAVLNREVDERLAGTLASIGWGIAEGVQLVRVHDVRETYDFLQMMHTIQHA